MSSMSPPTFPFNFTFPLVLRKNLFQFTKCCFKKRRKHFKESVDIWFQVLLKLHMHFIYFVFVLKKVLDILLRIVLNSWSFWFSFSSTGITGTPTPTPHRLYVLYSLFFLPRLNCTRICARCRKMRNGWAAFFVCVCQFSVYLKMKL